MTFTVLRDVLSQERLAMALSMINGVICVIPVLAPVLGYLILSHFDWRGIFVAMALVAAISGLVNLLLLKETRPARQPGSGAALPFALLRSPRFMLLSLLTSASVTAILAYVSVSPLILMKEFGFTTEQYSIVMMVMAGVSMSTSFLTPLLLRRLGKQKVLAVAHLSYLLAACSLFGSWQTGAISICCCRDLRWSVSGSPAASEWRWGRRSMVVSTMWRLPARCSASCRSASPASISGCWVNLALLRPRC